ncbi:unnamed protein product [Rhizophagus irregularis]|nr:unnamed protein product [Rhizophagus irregularis]
MPKAIAEDLKWRIILLYNDGYLKKQIAKLLYIGRALVKKVICIYAKWGCVLYKAAAERNEILRDAFIASIGQHITDQLLLQMNSFPSKNSVLVLDNAKIHHDQELLNYLDAFGVKVEFLPPYSSDLNPIKTVFSTIKQFLQRN